MKSFMIQYDVAAVFIFSIIIIYNQRIKNMHIFRNRVFFMYLITGFTSTIIDIIRCSLSLAGFSSRSLDYLNCGFYTCVIFMPVVFFIYICSLCNFFQTYPEERRSTLPFKIFFPVITSFLMVWMTPFTPESPLAVFHIADNGYVEEEFLAHIILFGIGYYYIVYGIIVVLLNRRYANLSVVVNMLMAFGLMTASIVLQMIFPYVRIIPMVFSLSSLHFTLFIQKPDLLLDSKTDVLNMQGFQIILDDYLVHKASFKLVVLSMEDVELFKRIFSEKRLDRLDLAVVDSIRQNCRNASLFKSEFFGLYYLLFRNGTDQDVEECIQYLNSRIAERWGMKGRKFNFSYRICIIDGKTDVVNADELRGIVTNFHSLSEYRGKTVYARDLNLERMKNFAYLEESVLRGITDNRFDVFYQPIYSVRSRRMTRAEALIRLRDKNGGYISPADFIPVAESNGMIFDISRFVFSTVCHLISRTRLEDFNIEKIGVNISVVDCMQEDLYEQMLEIIRENGISASSLNIEITETGAAGSMDVLANNMQKLSGAGIAMALDDFGFGNSNINYLLNLPFGMIKIDKQIIWSAWGNSKANITLKGTISMAHELGMEVLAEGVETNEQRIWLESLGCDFLQGYYFSSPVPKEEFLNLMKEQVID